MAQKETQTEKSSPFNFAPAEFAAMGQKQFEGFASAQSELFEKFEETRRQWLDRVQSEASLSIRICLEVDGGAFDSGRDDRVSGLGQSVAGDDGR